MYKEIEQEFAPKFESIELDFMTEYNNAIGRVSHYVDQEVVKNAVKKILSEVLAEYSKSKGKTKAGRIFRKISLIISKIFKT